jgi:hypothetical protein
MPLTYFQPSQVDSSFNGYLRNRIINGAMMIDQRYAGASVATSSGTGTYSVDRWQLVYDQTSKFTAQQNSGGVTPPAGFTNYLGAVSSSAYTVGASETFNIRQFIEGFNTADLAWGTASASTVTLSFWVRSSLTGTFGGAISGYSNTNSYPFTYTINGANTWEYKTVQIPGPTSGTWNTTNSGGIGVIFSLGTGSTLSGTAGAWSSSRYWSATGATSVVGTNGATLYITGVQLEDGAVATPFERRMYPQELAFCQRYCFVGLSDVFTNGVGATATIIWAHTSFKQTMRAAPSVTVSGTIQFSDDATADYTNASPTIGASSLVADGGRVRIDGWSGLTQYRSYNGVSTVNLGKFTFSAEL